jgi:hypothetical protein
MNKLIAALSATVIFSVSAFADAKKEYVTREYPWILRSPAALGMGGAYYTKSDSKYAPFYNPAGLNRIARSWRLDILSADASVNSDLRGLLKDADNTDFDNDTEVADLIKGHLGDIAHLGFTYYPGFTKKNFTFGYFTAFRTTVQPRNSVIPEVNLSAVADTGLVTGFAHGFMNDALSVGVSAKLMGRGSYNDTFTTSDFVSGKAEDKVDNLTAEEYSGTALLFDVGAIYDFNNLFNVEFSPRIGFAVNNIGIKTGIYGDLDIRKRDSTVGNSSLPTYATLSFGASPSIGYLQTDLILDIVDITKNFEEDDDWGKRINMGAELNVDLPFIRHFNFRCGLHQGYPTMGVGVDLYVLELNYAYYTEELGAYSGQLPDSRHVLEISIGI